MNDPRLSETINNALALLPYWQDGAFTPTDAHGDTVVYVTYNGATLCADCASKPNTSDPVAFADVIYDTYNGYADLCDDCARGIGPRSDCEECGAPDNEDCMCHITDLDSLGDAWDGAPCERCGNPNPDNCACDNATRMCTSCERPIATYEDMCSTCVREHAEYWFN